MMSVAAQTNSAIRMVCWSNWRPTTLNVPHTTAETIPNPAIGASQTRRSDLLTPGLNGEIRDASAYAAAASAWRPCASRARPRARRAGT